MPYDICWIIERLHEDGSWEPVFSDIRYKQMASLWETGTLAAHAAQNLCRRNQPLFFELSKVGTGKGNPDALAVPGLPQDASAYTKNYLDGDLKAINGYHVLEPKPLCGHGHIDLCRLQTLTESELKAENPGSYAERLLRTVLDMQPLLDHEVLFGLVRMSTGAVGAHHPQMDAASSHKRLAMTERFAGLLPIAPDSLRLIVAYEV